MQEYYIVDSHAHIFPSKIASKAVKSIGNFYGIDMDCNGTSDDLIQSGNTINVEKYIVHSTATTAAQVQSINEFIHSECETHSQFIGFGTLHTELYDFNSTIDHIKSLGLHGIKLHPDFQNFALDDPKAIEMFKAIAVSNLPVLIHMGDSRYDGSRPKKLARVLDTIPNLRVIAAHLGGYQRWTEAMECLIGRDLLIDTSSSLSFLPKKKALDIIHAHGVEKVVFGVDFPMWSHDEEFKRYLSLGLTPAENRMILADNILKYLNIDK